METGRKIAAGILTVVLVIPLAMGGLTLLSISPWVLNRSFYLELLDDEQLYRLALQEIDPQLELALTAVDPALEAIPPEALGEALHELLTPAYLRSETVRTVNQVFDALEQRSAAGSLYLDLAPLKEALSGAEGFRFAATLAAALPECLPGAQPRAPGSNLLRCRPENLSQEQATEVILSTLPELVEIIPDHLVIMDETGSTSSESSRPRLGSGGLLAIGITLTIMAAVLCLAVGFLAGRDRREKTLWMGWSLVLPTGLMLLIGLMIRLLLFNDFGYFGLRAELVETLRHSPELAQALLEKLHFVITTVARGFLTVGAVAGGIAGGFVVWGFSIEAGQRKNP